MWVIDLETDQASAHMVDDCAHVVCLVERPSCAGLNTAVEAVSEATWVSDFAAEVTGCSMRTLVVCLRSYGGHDQGVLRTHETREQHEVEDTLLVGSEAPV